MESSLFLSSSSSHLPTKSFSLSSSFNNRNTLSFSSSATTLGRSSSSRSGSRRPVVIRATIDRAKKEETVAMVKKHLENCYMLAAINYQGLTVKQFQELRKSLPEEATLVVAKNTLVFKAIEDTEWAVLKPCMKGMNAWLFVHTEEIPGALKPYRTFQREQKVENDFAGACFEGKFYGPEEVGKVLESMPSRAEVYAKMLGLLKGPSTALVGTLQAPARDLIMVLKAYIKKLEDEQEAATSSSS